MIVTISSISIFAFLLLTNKRSVSNEIIRYGQLVETVPDKIEQFHAQLKSLRPNVKLHLKLNVTAKAGESRFRRFINRRKVLFSRKRTNQLH